MSVANVGPSDSVEGLEKCRCLGCRSDIPIGLKIPYCPYCRKRCMEPEQRKTNRKFALFTALIWIWVWLAGLFIGMILGLLKRGFMSGNKIVDDVDSSMTMWDEKEHHSS